MSGEERKRRTPGAFPAAADERTRCAAFACRAHHSGQPGSPSGVEAVSIITCSPLTVLSAAERCHCGHATAAMDPSPRRSRLVCVGDIRSAAWHNDCPLPTEISLHPLRIMFLRRATIEVLAWSSGFRETARRGSLYVIDLIGVPYRIRTGVAAVREGHVGH